MNREGLSREASLPARTADFLAGDDEANRMRGGGHAKCIAGQVGLLLKLS